MTLTRRAFMQCSAAVIAAAALDPPWASASPPDAHEAKYYEKIDGNGVRCLLCPRQCRIGAGERGHCKVRENRDGALVSLVYGRPCALHLDPIEKKPFFHVLPGAQAVSLATVGCNLNCKFCQNWQISQSRPEDVEARRMPPARIVEQAVSLGAPAVAFTYSEPVVFIEYAQDIAKLARENGIRSVVVSNGYIRKEPLLDLCGFVDAIKIDLKAFEEPYYRDICNATLRPVLDTILTIRERAIWLELVYLVVPTLNDGTASIRSMARWVAANLGRDVPVHFSRFYPQYRLENLPPTPVSTLDTAYETCRAEGLNYVYVGNVPGHRAESTYCPSCSRAIIVRQGYRVERCDLRDGACRHCGHPIPGIWREARS
jgi:pyruvate formate lyase activating enzyme